MGGFTSKQFAPSIVAALVGAVVAIGTLSVSGTLTAGATTVSSLTSTGSIAGTGDNTYMGIDNAAPSSVGLVKKSGAVTRLAYGSINALGIAQSNTGTIDPTSTFTDVASFDTSGNFATFNNTTLGNGNTDLSTTTGHFRALGTAPALTSCGSSPIIAGSDNAGRFQTGSGATACTLTFSRTWSGATPACVLFREGSATPPTCTVSATAITCTVAAAGVVYNYVCVCAESGCA